MSPFSGCLSAILQLVILLAVFYMVKSPLTFVKGVSEEDINNYKNELQSANLEVNQAYPEISIIRHKGKEYNEKTNELKLYCKSSGGQGQRYLYDLSEYVGKTVTMSFKIKEEASQN